jgi:hypothetical protein
VVVAVNPVRVVLELTATLVIDALNFAGCWSRWVVLATLPIAVGSLAASGALISTAADPLRRWFHDRVAGTVVVPAPDGRA